MNLTHLGNGGKFGGQPMICTAGAAFLEVLNVHTNTSTTMEVISIDLHEKIIHIAMEGAVRKTIYGQILMGIIVEQHPTKPQCACFDSSSMFQVVVKQSSLEFIRDKVQAHNPCAENPLNEISIMQMMQMFGGECFSATFPHCMPIVSAAADKKSLYMIMPRMKCSLDLYDYLFENATVGSVRGNLTAQQRFLEVRTIFRAVMVGVRSLHAAGIAHRDLSCENILLSVQADEAKRLLHIEDVKVIDFGMACYHSVTPSRDVVDSESETDTDDGCTDSESRSVVGNQAACRFPAPFYGKMLYCPPECMPENRTAGDCFDPRTADIWACGIMLYTMLTGRALFDSNNETSGRFADLVNDPAHGLRALLYRKFPRNVVYSQPALIDLLVQMLSLHPNDRITADEILSHRWLVE